MVTPDEVDTKNPGPIGVYAIRFVKNLEDATINSLMKAMSRQIKLRYEGFEDLTPTRMAERLYVELFVPGGQGDSWPTPIYGYSRVYRDTDRRCWSW